LAQQQRVTKQQQAPSAIVAIAQYQKLAQQQQMMDQQQAPAQLSLFAH